MPYSVANLEQDLEGVLHGTTLNQITNLDGVINRAARKLLLDVDPQETIREIPFSTPVFDSVFEYALAPDVKGISILDIRPQVNRGTRDIFNQDYSQQFSLSAQSNGQNGLISQFNIKFNNSLKTIEVNSATAPAAVIVNTASGVSINGSWIQGGAATAPTTNNINWVANGGSIQFDIAAGADPLLATMTNSTQDANDLSAQQDQSTWFLWLNMPVGDDFEDVNLRWGSSATDYWQATAQTMTQAGTAFQNGWNQLAFQWSPATITTVGSPDVTNLTFLEVLIHTNGNEQVGVLLNNITCQMGQILNYLYYSKYMFRDANTGAFQETVTDTSNLINLDTESYNMLFYQVAYLASQQQQGKNALGYDGQFFLNQYNEAVTKYKLRYKSQLQKPKMMYYKMPKPFYGWGAAGPWWPRG